MAAVVPIPDVVSIFLYWSRLDILTNKISFYKLPIILSKKIGGNKVKNNGDTNTVAVVSITEMKYLVVGLFHHLTPVW